LFLKWKKTGILTLSTIEIWSLRHQMEETLKFGTSISNPWLSEPDWITNHGISRVLVKPTTCKSGVPTQDGTKSSDIKESNLWISRTERSLTSNLEKILKGNQFRYGLPTTVPTRNGRSFTLIRPRLLPQVLRNSLVSESMFHSSLCPDYQWRELLSALEPTTWYWEDT